MADVKILTSEEAAVVLRVKPQTLRAWRMAGRGPDWFRLSGTRCGRVYYDVRALARWLEQRQEEGHG